MNKFKNINGTKYNSKKTIVDGIKFDSQLESRFYEFIRDTPQITLIERQTSFILQDKFRTKEGEAIRAIIYKCDFYIEYEGDRYYVDSKGNQDAVFKLKHKMWLHRYGDENILLVCKSIKELCKLIGLMKEKDSKYSPTKVI